MTTTAENVRHCRRPTVRHVQIETLEPIPINVETAAEILAISKRAVRYLLQDDPTFPKARRPNGSRRLLFVVEELREWAKKAPTDRRSRRGRPRAE